MFSTKMKVKSSRHKLNLTRAVKEYNESTSLHGLKYTTEYNRHFFERAFWMIVVVAFLTLGIFLTIRIVNKWQTAPIITTIESTNYPLSKVPFPAVTICPNYKGIKGKVATEVCNRKWLKDYSKVLYCGIKIRECVRTGAAGARTHRSLGHHLLHSLILRLLVLCALMSVRSWSFSLDGS